MNEWSVFRKEKSTAEKVRFSIDSIEKELDSKRGGQQSTKDVSFEKDNRSRSNEHKTKRRNADNNKPVARSLSKESIYNKQSEYAQYKLTIQPILLCE